MYQSFPNTYLDDSHIPLRIQSLERNCQENAMAPGTAVAEIDGVPPSTLHWKNIVLFLLMVTSTNTNAVTITSTSTSSSTGAVANIISMIIPPAVCLSLAVSPTPDKAPESIWGAHIPSLLALRGQLIDQSSPRKLPPGFDSGDEKALWDVDDGGGGCRGSIVV